MKTWKKIALGSFALLFLGGSLFLSKLQKKKQLEASERATGLISYIDDTPKTKEDFVINEGSVQDFIEASSWLYFSYKAPEEALKMLNKAQRKAERSWNPKDKPLGVIDEYKALCFKDIGMLDSALVYIQKAIKENKSIGWKRGLAGNYHNIANIYREQKILEKALTNYEKSEELYRELGLDFFVADMYVDKANLYNEKGNIKEAISYFENAMSLSEKQKNYLALGTAYKRLSDLYKKQGEKDKADDLDKKYSSLIKELEKKGFKF